MVKPFAELQFARTAWRSWRQEHVRAKACPRRSNVMMEKKLASWQSLIVWGTG
jgi:hypothetical protein